MTTKIEVTTENITPAMCIAWLEKNEDNRILNNPHIARLARTMVKKVWDLNGESLKFDTKGNILDGQHRMWACIEANVPFKTLVVKGLPRKVFDSLDTGKNRSASDILSINNEISVHTLAAALKHVGRYYDGKILQSYKYTNKEIEELLVQHSELRDYVKKANTLHNVRWCAGSIVVTAWYLASRKHKTKADEFFTSFITGTNLEAGSVILVLRNKFIDIQSSSIQRLNSLQKLELIINAWNLWRKDKTVKHFKTSTLSITSSDFPNFK